MTKTMQTAPSIETTDHAQSAVDATLALGAAETTSFAGPAALAFPWTAPPSFGLFIEGTEGNDLLQGSSLADAIHGRGGNDRIYGEAGDDLLFGEAGDDRLSGGDGNDQLSGGEGRDHLTGGRGADRLDGGAGDDTASYAGSSSGVVVDLGFNQGYGGDAEGDTFSSIEYVVGSAHADGLYGNNSWNVFNAGDGDDTISGLGGDDWLFGEGGNDLILGGLGQDYIYGGTGDDTLIGGEGADTFVFQPGGGHDTIRDFVSGTDRIVMQGFDGRLLGTDGRIARGDILGNSSGRDTTHDFDKSDQLYFDYASNQLVLLDMSQDDLSARVTHGTVIATFENGNLVTDDIWFG
jgi:Ca2+-binding RTX toxin-like protein